MDFIDLYAGIGGIRFAFEAHGNECVFSSEWNNYSQITYNAFHGEIPFGNIHDIEDIENEIPDHHLLTAGFPCQPFSLAGVSKKNSLGRLHGFDDPTQGTEFFKVKEILRIKQPEIFLLENVKNLRSHDQGRTFQTICESLTDVGYTFSSRIIDAAHWVPQHRERIYIIGFRNNLGITEGQIEALFPEPPQQRIYELTDIIIPENEIRELYGDRYTLGIGTWNALQRHRDRHQNRGNGFGFNMIRQPFANQITRTMSARYYKDGAEILLEQEGGIPRRITPLEACMLQGFPEQCYRYFNGEIEQPVSDGQIYKQFGNSVAVPVLTAIAENMTAFVEQNHLIEHNHGNLVVNGN
ncbi:DNA (cytosine-5-)-methyltransferase [Flagellimonas taeanensis]|uniref:DNA (cytosine-5-)-methyltransferase n=1 Tax=Flavobacteriaceae TaxID=49546 RepID=UPI000E680802|nr:MULTISPECIES: DNA (cytosine-5-)-methyltransferase [Allomuricauda]MDC6386278.1 DNA (cytosine-5-)-methyltransferase [Muricauda sp. SK9]RIV48046.1 DNA (cytosine-5-)-methyltransferase [Allomuricauda taeanensis]